MKHADKHGPPPGMDAVESCFKDRGSPEDCCQKFEQQQDQDECMKHAGQKGPPPGDGEDEDKD